MKQVGELVGRIGSGILMENTANISSTEQETEEVCPLCKGIGYLRANVPVGHPNFGKLIPCTCRLVELAQQRAESLRAVSELDALSRMTFESFISGGRGLSSDKQDNLRWAYEEARLFAEKPEGWLIFKGGYGCGKTHLAAAIANVCVERGQPVLFRAVPDLLDHLRAAFAPSSPTGYDARFDQVRKAPVLILDDLGTESLTPWAREKLFQIFNYRYNSRLPTVITTNRELEEIPMRLRSRLNDLDVSRIVTILAPDYRGSGVAPDQSDLSTLSLHSSQTFESFDLRQGEGLPRDDRESLERAFNVARGFAENLPRQWLIFIGTYGCGKTHLAAAIANYRAAQGQPVLFVVVPDLLDHLRATFNPQSTLTFYQQFEEVRRAPLLILDDLGTESATPWAREKLYQVFDYRYNARLPTVITTALNIEKIDPYLRTRMLDTVRSDVWEIVVPAYRGGAAARRKPTRRSKARR